MANEEVIQMDGENPETMLDEGELAAETAAQAEEQEGQCQ